MARKFFLISQIIINASLQKFQRYSLSSLAYFRINKKIMSNIIVLFRLKWFIKESRTQQYLLRFHTPFVVPLFRRGLGLSLVQVLIIGYKSLSTGFRRRAKFRRRQPVWFSSSRTRGRFGTNRKRRSSWEAASEFRDPPVKVDRLNDDDDDAHLCNVLFWPRAASTMCSLSDEISLISFTLNRQSVPIRSSYSTFGIVHIIEILIIFYCRSYVILLCYFSECYLFFI